MNKKTTIKDSAMLLISLIEKEKRNKNKSLTEEEKKLKEKLSKELIIFFLKN